tara:strand:+ start:238 stop:414 length:177 start_codon:yes stop_codon:yes gene_type:complete
MKTVKIGLLLVLGTILIISCNKSDNEISDKLKIQPELLFSNQGTKRVFEIKKPADNNG